MNATIIAMFVKFPKLNTRYAISPTITKKGRKKDFKKERTLGKNIFINFKVIISQLVY
jgi:hypothetical protein